MECCSKSSFRATLRPSACCIPFQFLKALSTSALGETVMIVLSKLRIFTVVSDMPITVPSAPACGTVIQSPMCIMSLLVRRMPATRPSIVSLNTSISTAEVAPSPAITVSGFRPIMIAMTTTTAIR